MVKVLTTKKEIHDFFYKPKIKETDLYLYCTLESSFIDYYNDKFGIYDDLIDIFHSIQNQSIEQLNNFFKEINCIEDNSEWENEYINDWNTKHPDMKINRSNFILMLLNAYVDYQFFFPVMIDNIYALYLYEGSRQKKYNYKFMNKLYGSVFQVYLKEIYDEYYEELDEVIEEKASQKYSLNSNNNRKNEKVFFNFLFDDVKYSKNLYKFGYIYNYKKI